MNNGLDKISTNKKTTASYIWCPSKHVIVTVMRTRGVPYSTNVLTGIYCYCYKYADCECWSQAGSEGKDAKLTVSLTFSPSKLTSSGTQRTFGLESSGRAAPPCTCTPFSFFMPPHHTTPSTHHKISTVDISAICHIAVIQCIKIKRPRGASELRNTHLLVYW
jgi:hypothetical protein